MNLITQNFRTILSISISSLLLAACQHSETPTDTTAQTHSESLSESINAAAIDTAILQIDEDGLMQHINILASDEFEGRAPSTPGGRKTVQYLEDEYQKLGLTPVFDDGEKKSFRQAVDLMELTVTNNPAVNLSFADGTKQTLPYKEQSMVFTSRATTESVVSDSELVFVGYGVVAPEYDWNDYQGIDMTGKTAVILVNDPGFRSTDDSIFKGNTMTYYGRWTYKYEEAARQGAVAAIIVHEDKAAGYPWEVVSGSWSGAQYTLFTENGNMDDVAVAAWINKPAAENLFTKSGLNYPEMVELAGQAEFKPVPMPVALDTQLELTSKRSVSYNVGGLIKGRLRADEIFVYTAHWDHIGIKPGDDGDDVIYNGAQDNATGTAALLELAQAYNALPQAPERSILFLAVTAEESGLLGSRYYAENPAFAMAQTVAGINIDGMSTFGATDDIVVVGYGNSEMDKYLKQVSDVQNRVLVQEPTPEKGFFYRSDHFNLAKKGVPMLYAEAGLKVRNKPEGYGQQESDKYLNERYHKPADEVHADWDNGGILQDLEAHFRIGIEISDSQDWPAWSEGNEFQAIRQASRN